MQDTRVRANGAGLAPEQPETIEDFAFAAALVRAWMRSDVELSLG